LGSTITAGGRSITEIKTRIIALATAAMTKLNTIWKSRDVSTATKIKLFKALVISTLLYGCETWTLNAEMEKRLQAFEMKSFRKILRISYTEHKTNDFVWTTVNQHAGQQEPLLSTIKRRKLAWYGHVTHHDSLSKTILQGYMDGKRKRGRPRKTWIDNIKEWTTTTAVSQLNEIAQDRDHWKRLTAAATESGTPTIEHRSRDD